MEQIKKVGIWLRVSTSMQVEETDSLEHHEKRAKAYCEAKGWKVHKIYSLEGISGKNILQHSTTKQMLLNIKSKEIDTLVFSSLSRLARNTKELLSISEIFQKNNASLVSLKEAIDTSSPAGRLFFTVLSALATFEAEETSARVKASVITRAKLGKSLGGQAPYGYKKENNKLVLDEKEAVIRKEMFTIFKQCQRRRTTAEILNKKGYRTRKGSLFSDTTITRLLTDPIAKGIKRTNYTKSRGAKKGWDIKPKEEWIYTEVPPIVSEKLFDEVNTILQKQKESRRPIKRLPKHLFTGLVFCTSCDKKMKIISSNPSKYTCPKCKSKIPKLDLEDIYRKQMQQYLLSPKELSLCIQKINESIQDKKTQLKILKKELEKLNTQSEKIYDLYIEEKITSTTFEKKHKPLEERINQLEAQIPKEEAEIDILTDKILNKQILNSDGVNLYNKWDSLQKEDKIKIVQTLTKRIDINKHEIEINLYFSPFALDFDINKSSLSKDTLNAPLKGNHDTFATQQQGFIAAKREKSAGN